jgi:hypothetical protein
LGGAAQTDFETLARLQAERYMYFWNQGGTVYVAITAFFFTGLFILAFGFGFEFAQAAAFLITPLAIIGALSLRAAFLVAQGDHGTGDALHTLLWHLRLYVQAIGFVFILMTIIFGFYQNITAGIHG